VEVVAFEEFQRAAENSALPILVNALSGSTPPSIPCATASRRYRQMQSVILGAAPSSETEAERAAIEHRAQPSLNCIVVTPPLTRTA
jgi:hypothetical protein